MWTSTKKKARLLWHFVASATRHHCDRSSGLPLFSPLAVFLHRCATSARNLDRKVPQKVKPNSARDHIRRREVPTNRNSADRGATEDGANGPDPTQKARHPQNSPAGPVLGLMRYPATSARIVRREDAGQQDLAPWTVGQPVLRPHLTARELQQWRGR